MRCPNVSLIINDTKPETPDGSVGSINGFEHAVLSNGNIAVTWYAGINKTNSFGTEKVEDVYTRVLDPVSGTFVSEEINLSNASITNRFTFNASEYLDLDEEKIKKIVETSLVIHS